MYARCGVFFCSFNGGGLLCIDNTEAVGLRVLGTSSKNWRMPRRKQRLRKARFTGETARENIGVSELGRLAA